MARNTRGGLGRGLNSLLGNVYEEAIPEEKPVKRVERVMVEGEDVPSESIKAVRVSDIQRETVTYVTTEDTYSQVTDTPVLATDGQLSNQVDVQPEVKVEVVHKETDEVPLKNIHPNPDQPRTSFKQQDLEELAASIEKDGLLQPILVRSLGEEQYQIIAGERRWQACCLLNLETVPVRIKEADDEQALELALVENIQRSDLNPIEEAYGYRRMMERRGLTQAEVAQAVSKGRSTIANALRLLDLPEDAQQLLFEEKITAGHARAILSIPTREGRQKLTEKLLAENLTVREAEAIARLLSGKVSTSTKREPLPKAYKSVASELRKVLAAPVRVKSVKGKNKIEIEFKDEEDLRRLFERMASSID